MLNKERWDHAKRIIPGGNSLISKRPELHSPVDWPTYYNKAKGCYVWDLQGNKYLDMSIMGIGPNTLGYANDTIDSEVIKAVRNGNMSTLNCLEEIQLAEKLIEIHKWADMVKFARSGGEANAISIRIARAATGKDKILFCGYHGWHDWYLSAELNKNSLNDHLFEKTGIAGVPSGLQNTNIPFKWNDLEDFKNKLLLYEDDIAAVKMEVTRNILPDKGFLESIRNLCSQKNIVLIFDECTSGFRQTFGGLHLKYQVNPDIAVFGKALGNGYAITAVIGIEAIMKEASKSFISSTFWSERIGFVAGIATLNEMEKIKSWEIITSIGSKVQDQWMEISSSFGVPISVGVLPSIANFNFKSERYLEYKSYLSLELLKAKILGGNLFFASTAHKSIDMTDYFKIFERVIKDISLREKDLIGQLVPDEKIVETSFQRLN
tara:strand:- start:5309 stop:6613 length:1305 start_codon:yes stop_codon:yes gene_type:complete